MNTNNNLNEYSPYLNNFQYTQQIDSSKKIQKFIGSGESLPEDRSGEFEIIDTNETKEIIETKVVNIYYQHIKQNLEKWEKSLNGNAFVLPFNWHKTGQPEETLKNILDKIKANLERIKFYKTAISNNEILSEDKIFKIDKIGEDVKEINDYVNLLEQAKK
jgi:hypothetical protein